MKLRLITGLALAGTLALAACQDFDPYQKVDYAETAYDRHLKRGDMTKDQYNTGMKTFKPQGTPPPASSNTTATAPSGSSPSSGASGSSGSTPATQSSPANSGNSSAPMVVPQASPTNWP